MRESLNNNDNIVMIIVFITNYDLYQKTIIIDIIMNIIYLLEFQREGC